MVVGLTRRGNNEGSLLEIKLLCGWQVDPLEIACFGALSGTCRPINGAAGIDPRTVITANYRVRRPRPCINMASLSLSGNWPAAALPNWSYL